MVRLLIAFFVLAMLACGESDTPQAGAAAPLGTGGVEGARAPETPEPSAAADPKVQGCLDLIRQLKYQEALPVCLAALEVDPGNEQVRDAAEKARAETAKLATAQAASRAAGEGAAAEATSKLGEATGGMADKLGQ